jgi:hypothetical protein
MPWRRQCGSSHTGKFLTLTSSLRILPNRIGGVATISVHELDQSSEGNEVTRSIAIFAVPLALACTGSITGETPGDHGAPAGNGVVGGAGGSGVDPQSNVPGRTPMAAPHAPEYTYTVRDLLGEDVSTLLASFPADGRTTDGSDYALTPTLVPLAELKKKVHGDHGPRKQGRPAASRR